MGFLANTWLRYVDRSYEQIKSQVLTVMQTRVPEITDHTESNLFVKMVSIWAAIAEMLGYYTDNAAREARIDACRLYESMVSIAKRHDYRIHGRIAASADLKFTLNVPAPSDILIPAGTEVRTQDNIRFFTAVNATILTGNTFVIVAAKQAVSVVNTALGNADGSEGLEVVLGDDIEDNSVALRVNGIAWTLVDTLAYSNAINEHYRTTVNGSKNYIAQFGNNMNGKIPANGAAFTADWRVTLGAAGNVDAGLISILVSAIVLPPSVTISVTNEIKASGGSDVETIDQMRNRIPLSTRTVERAVTPQGYIDVAELCAGVAKAGLRFTCGKTIDIFVVPDGGGVASGILLAAVQAWMDLRKMITTKVNVFAAGEVHVQLVIDLQVKANYDRVVTTNLTSNNLTEFLSYLKQNVEGQVQLSDIYQTIENTEGVEFSNVTKMVAIPYARPLDLITPILVWTRGIKPASNSTIKWEIAVISPTQFQITKDNSFIGTFGFGVPIVQPEIDFSIPAGPYSVGNRWEFYTYNYYGTLTLAEPSLPVAIAADITINATGGI